MRFAPARAALAAALLVAATCGAAKPGFEPIGTVAAGEPAQAASEIPASPPAPASSVAAPPSESLGDLYRDVELARLFPDSKTFADMIPKEPPEKIVAAYHAARQQTGFDLRKFVAAHFETPSRETRPYASDPKQTVVQHIDTLWNVLTRDPDTAPNPWSSLLPLPAPYVVPGGRFDEVYYWDSYFIMLGLVASGRHDLADDELKNFAALIDRYGHIPNGNRTYYLSRSQPPFFSQMVGLLAEHEGESIYLQYLPELKAEYDYWMSGAASLAPGQATRHVVRLTDGTVLNRYWDERAAPRDESYREDVLTARSMPQREPGELWRDLRAGGETGWDFSSRWFADDRTLATIDVTSLVPVDLNALLYGLERTLAKAYRLQGDASRAENFNARATARAEAIRHWLWDPRIGAFADYDFVRGKSHGRLTAATAYPLFAGVASRQQAIAVAQSIKRGLLRPGGIATTEVHTGQQWDEPNGWAPLQYLAVVGLRRYGESALARTIATRWIRTNVDYYARTGKLVEKYDIGRNAGHEAAGGGEYPLQDGFGWTNGVLRALLLLYPNAVDIDRAVPAAVSNASEAGAAH
ncbi:alpha,alpha-trehalase TreF [Trinickia diaoshuihuensis]|uniref:alpha,alpha-trehalase TreF n=1 Tax=Trinickia diaoshuihuensis TaxID=2292265 RepID=UPI000E283328|nr:alpha,alpha-trehalase TreF [Trinickia diaoshuihuensis]